MSYDGSSAKSYIRHTTEKERLDNLAFASFPEDYLPYAANPGHQRTAGPPPYLLWGEDRRRRPAKKRRNPKCAGALLCAIALVVIAILAVVAISVYLGVVTNLFRSPVVSVSARFKASEEFSEELLNTSSPKFLEKADVYQAKVEKAFLSSSLEPAFIAARIYSFRPGLAVFFRVYLDRRKIKENDGESPPTELVRELITQKLTADPESVHVKENEELLSEELRPVETIHPSVSTTSKPTTERNGHQRPHSSGGVGQWRPVPIEDSVIPSFADRPAGGVGSVRSPEEIPRRNPTEGYGSVRVLEDTAGRSPQLSVPNREGVGSVKVLEEPPVKNPPLNTRDSTGYVRLLEESPILNVQRVPQNNVGSGSSLGASTVRNPLLPTDRVEGIGSVRLLPETPIESPELTNLRLGIGSIRLTDVNPQLVPKPPANLESVGPVRLLDEVPKKNAQFPGDSRSGIGLVRGLENNPLKKNPPGEGLVRPMEDTITLAPSVSIVVRNRSRSDKPRNLLTRLNKGQQNTDLSKTQNVGVGSIREIITEEGVPLPLQREPPIFASRLLDIGSETTKADSEEQSVTTVTSDKDIIDNAKIHSQNISTEVALIVQNNKEFRNKIKDSELNFSDFVQNETTTNNISSLSTEAPADEIFNKETKPHDLKSPLENILFSLPTQSSFFTTDFNNSNFTEGTSTDSFNLNDSVVLNENKNESSQNLDLVTETVESNEKEEILEKEDISSAAENSDEDIHSSIVNYSQYLFPETHYHTIENDTNTNSEDSYERHTLEGHGFHKPSNSSSTANPLKISTFDSATRIPIVSTIKPSVENHTSSQDSTAKIPATNSIKPSMEDQMSTLDSTTEIPTTSTVKPSMDSQLSTIDTTTNIPLASSTKPLTESQASTDSIDELQTTSSLDTTNQSEEDTESSTHINLHHTESTIINRNTSGTIEEVWSNNDETANVTTDDASQQAKVVPQLQADFLSNDIGAEEESGDENDERFEDEILRHITTLRPQSNGSDISIHSCPTGSVPCTATGDGCGVRCDMRRDCPNNEDETGCLCSDLLRAMGQSQKICDGVDDCSDKSDEANCPWCPSSDYFRCPGTRTCITMDRVCDGKDDCPGAQDERRCVSLAESSPGAESYDYRSEGYLIVRRSGQWGKLCLDALTQSPDLERRIRDLGKAVCSALTYRNMSSSIHTQDKAESESSYFQISAETANNRSASSLFEPTSCKGKEVLRVQCKTLECGLRPSAPPSQRRRIVGGRSADGAGSWPWAAALYREGDFQCGAALISDIWLVSAAHCFYSSQHAYWTARLGVLRRGSELPSGGEQVRKIQDIILHPQYEDVGFINDIALLRMDQPVPFSDALRPICLPSSPAEDASLWHGRRCSVVGWGKLYEIGHTFPDSLQEVRLPVISSSECQRRSIFLPAYRITPNMFCAGYDRGGRDACLGDSGGPMACQRPANGRWVLLGVTSNGDGCGRPGRPGVYSQVAGFLTWIQETISEGKVFKGLTGSESTCSRGTRCRLGRCIPQARVCDGRRDCAGGEDENGC